MGSVQTLCSSSIKHKQNNFYHFPFSIPGIVGHTPPPVPMPAFPKTFSKTFFGHASGSFKEGGTGHGDNLPAQERRRKAWGFYVSASTYFLPDMSSLDCCCLTPEAGGQDEGEDRQPHCSTCTGSTFWRMGQCIPETGTATASPHLPPSQPPPAGSGWTRKNLASPA